MNPFAPSTVVLCITGTGLDWLDAYAKKLNGIPPTSFYARDVWAEILAILARKPVTIETLWLQFKPSRLSHLIRRTELRINVDLLLTNGYIEPLSESELTTK